VGLLLNLKFPVASYWVTDSQICEARGSNAPSGQVRLLAPPAISTYATQKRRRMKSIIATTLIALCLSACNSGGSSASATSGTGTRNNGARLTEDQKHRLYTAALAASESPLDTDLFKDVCRTIGIFDANGVPNDNYMPFVSAHIDWALRPETEQLRRELNTKEKAKDYVAKHLPR
jgi:hypothetical protein